MRKEIPLEQLVKLKKISQLTCDRVNIAKQYIEHKYNLKVIKNKEWINIMEKINNLNFSEDEKKQIFDNIIEQESIKHRKERKKNTILNYESLGIIGRGAFGEVHVCREILTGKIYAIKKIKKKVLKERSQIIHTRNEQLIMSKIKSPWIVELKSSFQEDDYLFLIMEYLPGGDLMNYLILKDILSEEDAKFYIAEIILAIESIHKLDCIHRDIKPDNILIGKDGHIKLSDFGLSKASEKLYDDYYYNNKNIDDTFNENKKTHNKKNYSCVGTAYYVAPEVLNKEGYRKEIDWWSVGVIFYEMLIGYAPFCSKETKEVCHKILNWQKYLNFPKEKKISDNAKDFIIKLINNSNSRLGTNGIDEIKNHVLFKNFNWNEIRKMKPPFVPILKNDWDMSYFEQLSPRENFYPEKSKYKRKNMEYIGYTYNDDDDRENNDLNKEFDIALQMVIDKINNDNNENNNDNYDKNDNDNNYIKVNLNENNRINNMKVNKTNFNNNVNKLSLKKIKLEYKKNLSPNNSPNKNRINNMINYNYSNYKKNKSPSPKHNNILKSTEKNYIYLKSKATPNSINRLKKSASEKNYKERNIKVNNFNKY
jgi:serine/threonine kinase 38